MLLDQQKTTRQLMLQAQEAYAWFTGYTSSGGKTLHFDSEDVITVGDFQYDRVVLKSVLQSGESKPLFVKRNECTEPLPPPIETMNALQSYLQGLFSAETVEELLQIQVEEGYPLYLEQEGKLYRFGGYVGQLDYDSVRMSLQTAEEETSRAVEAKLYYAAWGKQYTAQYTYLMEQNADGQWIFTNFKLPAELCLQEQPT